MARSLNDWLSAYLNYTKNTEPPLTYHTWVGISVLASSLQRRVYMEWGDDTIYPNQYIILIGPSGEGRKSYAINIGDKLLTEISIRTTSQSITQEALIRSLANPTNFVDPTKEGGKVRFQSAVTAVSSELKVFLGNRDRNSKFLAYLTDWYDSKDEWIYETKNEGIDTIKGICFNLLAASAWDWLPGIFPPEAIGGGFTSRCIFVVEERKGKIVADPNKTKQDIELKEQLLHDLEEIHLIAGEMKFTPEAKQLYINWYIKGEKEVEQGNFPISDPKFRGYCSRRATHVKKIAMAMSVSRDNDLLVTEEDFNRALSAMKQVEMKMSRAFKGLGTARYAEATENIMNYLMIRKKATRSDILRRFVRDVDTFIMDVVERVMVEMRVVKLTILENGDKLYEFIGTEDPDD